MSALRRNSCVSSVILPASSKEIEFVVPPTVSPYASNRALNIGGCRGFGPGSAHLTPNYTPATNSGNSPGAQRCDSEGGGGTPVVNVVNRGWNLLQDVFTSSTSLNEGENRKSRSASLSVSTLGINHTNSLGVSPRMANERRASTNSIYLAPNSPGR